MRALPFVVVLLSVATFAQLPEPLWDTGTFSILGYDPATGEVGGAVQSRVFSVGNGVLWADANVGVAATQAIVDVGYGARAVRVVRGGGATPVLAARRRRPSLTSARGRGRSSCCGTGSRRRRSSRRSGKKIRTRC